MTDRPLTIHERMSLVLADLPAIGKNQVNAQQTACLEWAWAVTSAGYGALQVQGQLRLAHRHAYELAVGPIPAGMTIDHLCCNKKCWNPTHLELVTRGENSRRGQSLIRVRRSGNSGKPLRHGTTHCHRKGCRCGACCAAVSAHNKRMYLQRRERRHVDA